MDNVQDSPRYQLRARAQQTGTESLPEDHRGMLLAMMDTLPEAEAHHALELVSQAFEYGFNRGLVEEAKTWRRVLAHVPGIAPVLELTYNHIHGGLPACHN